jgi:hypothetical protein
MLLAVELADTKRVRFCCVEEADFVNGNICHLVSGISGSNEWIIGEPFVVAASKSVLKELGFDPFYQKSIELLKGLTSSFKTLRILFD